jgi:multiple antibiotic resistance protein
MLTLVEYVKIFTAILVIVNPIGAVPVFLTMAGGQSQQERCGIARLAAFSVAVVLVAACVFGESLLRFFGISMASFRVGGGILVMLIAIAMFHAQLSWSKATPEETKEAEQKADVAVVPLAIPLLAGPGAISTVIIFADQSSAWAHKGCLTVTCVMVAITIWISLRMAIPIGAWLGKTGINIVTRLMSLLLAAIAVEIIVGGLDMLLPGLVKR